ncbi:hypothetical protein ACFQY4_44280 [Catellatospora bangladeshensis]|uniref:hypothetical protein n=1 Tax=Catellatospora bangladeshensis TaxID=310355 RepID=UPI00362333F5
MRAFQEAETQYRRALDLWPGVPDAAAVAGTAKLRVLTVAADAARWAGHVDQAVRWAREAIDEAAGADGDRVGELYERLGSYLWEARAVDESAAAYRAAEQHLADGPPSAAGSRVQAALATVAVRDGQHVDGLARAKRAGELARAVRARAEEGRALNSEGLALTMLDEPDEGCGRCVWGWRSRSRSTTWRTRCARTRIWGCAWSTPTCSPSRWRCFSTGWRRPGDWACCTPGRAGCWPTTPARR